MINSESVSFISRLMLSHYEAAAVILAGIGLGNLLIQRNVVKKIIGFNIMNTALCVFLAARDSAYMRSIGVIQTTDASQYLNPVSSSLVFVIIIVTVSITAFALSLTLRFYERSGTLYTDDALNRLKRENSFDYSVHIWDDPSVGKQHSGEGER